MRINPEADGEVVWGRRIDPARARLVSVPLPSSGHRWGDIVLHDGAPNGTRTVSGHEYSVFDELERLVSSDKPTLVAHLECATPVDAEAVEHLFTDAGTAAEDWTRTVASICKACSEGRPHERHEGGAPWTPRRRVGIAGELDWARSLPERWAAESPFRRAVDSLDAGDA